MDQGFRVTAADVSEAMVSIARTNIAASQSPTEGHLPHVDFEVRDVMQTGYADNQFDAVVCNRLFHHFTESSTRLRALKELRRISRGPVIISFFNSFALDAAYRSARQQGARTNAPGSHPYSLPRLSWRTPDDRLPGSTKNRRTLGHPRRTGMSWRFEEIRKRPQRTGRAAFPVHRQKPLQIIAEM